MNKHDQAEEVKKVYDKLSENYDEILSNADYGGIKFIDSIISDYKIGNPSILDLACANGSIGRYLIQKGIKPEKLVGIEISEKMVGECSKHNVYNQIIQHDLEKGFPEKLKDKFDLVTAFGFMEFIKDKSNLLEDICEHLNTNGELWISLEELFDLKAEPKKLSGVCLVFRYAITKEDALALIENVGFKIINSQSMRGYIARSVSEDVPYLFVRAVKKHARIGV